MWAKTRQLRVAVFAALVTITAVSGAVAAPASLEPLLSDQLADVQKKLARLCEPSCGHVVIESSPETNAAELEPIEPGLSRLLYNEGFMRRVVRKYGRSAAYAIVAHEYGHHVDDRSGASAWTHELRADAVAGCALARGDVPLAPALAWMRHEHLDAIWHHVYGDPSDPEEVLRKYVGATHPYWIERIGALKRGVEVCGTNGGSLALQAFFDRTRTAAPEFQEDPATLFAELPFRQGTARTLALGATAETLKLAVSDSFRFGRYSLPPGTE